MKLLGCVLLVVSLSATLSDAAISPRIVGGVPVDTIRRFPHHVAIRTITISGEIRNCSGSILSEVWILSSIGCVFQGARYQLDFQRLYLNSTVGSFSVLLDNSNVYLYPTEYDDLALIRLPLKLTFSTNVKPISLYKEDSYGGNQFAVMPGFTSNKDKLTYGMFRITTTQECKLAYGSVFDEYLEICTQGWNNNENVPCEGNQGGGLIVGWPSNPRLIGVFSTPLSCKSHVPAIYTKVARYIQWIQSITGNLEPSSSSSDQTSQLISGVRK